MLRRALEIVQASADTPQIARAEAALGMCLLARGRLEEAEPMLRHADSTLTQIGVPDPFLEWTVDALVRLYTQQGKRAEAARYRGRLDAASAR
jgi:tetratricopeptide (TPR) repeat protein